MFRNYPERQTNTKSTAILKFYSLVYFFHSICSLINIFIIGLVHSGWHTLLTKFQLHKCLPDSKYLHVIKTTSLFQDTMKTSNHTYRTLCKPSFTLTRNHANHHFYLLDTMQNIRSYKTPCKSFTLTRHQKNVFTQHLLLQGILKIALILKTHHENYYSLLQDILKYAFTLKRHHENQQSLTKYYTNHP